MTLDPPPPSPPKDPLASGRDSPPSPAHEGPEALQDLGPLLQDLSTNLGVYLRSYVERSKVTLRQAFIGIAVYPIAIFVIAGLILSSLVFLSYGIALGLTDLLGGREWLGFLITGVVLIAATSGALRYFLVTRQKKIFREKVSRYEKQIRQEGLDPAGAAGLPSQE